MAGLKRLNTRIINKHATAAVWNTTDFTPLQAELIIYDPGYDSKDGKTYTRERFKIGDGSTPVQDLPFANEVEAAVSKDTQSVEIVTDVSASTYTDAQYVAPSFSHNVDEEVLTVQFDAGSYTPASFTSGNPTKQSIEFLKDVSVAVNPVE